MAELKFPTLEELGRQGGEWALDVFEYKGQTIREWADKITTGEYQPVKHGRWISKGFWIECSNCKKTLVRDNIETTAVFENGLPTYCPHCGAKMDGEE